MGFYDIGYWCALDHYGIAVDHFLVSTNKKLYLCIGKLSTFLMGINDHAAGEDFLKYQPPIPSMGLLP